MDNQFTDERRNLVDSGADVAVKLEIDNEESHSYIIKTVPYQLLDDKAIKGMLETKSFLTELTMKFEKKLKLKMFRMTAVLEGVVENIQTHGDIQNWNWEIIVKGANKMLTFPLCEADVQKKTLVILDWLVEKDSSVVKVWKSDSQESGGDPVFHSGASVASSPEPDDVSGREAGGEDDFVVVKAEQDEFHNSSGEVVDDGTVDTVQEEDDGDTDGSTVTSSVVTDMETAKSVSTPTERFFHNGEELDLEDVLKRYDRPGQSTDAKKTSESEEDEEEPMEEDENEDYEPEDDDEEESEEELEEEDQAMAEEGDEGGMKEEDSEGDPGSMSLAMLKQALMRKRGQSMALMKSNTDTDGSVDNTSGGSSLYVNMKPSDPNIGGTALSFKDLSEVERTVLEAAVNSNLSVFRTTTSTVEERLKKMAVWAEIANRVNTVSKGKTRTPEELVTIWSKKLFVDHVSSKKSLLVNRESDQKVNGSSTNSAFKSLISKSKSNSDLAETTTAVIQPKRLHSSTTPSPPKQVNIAGLKGQLSTKEQAVFDAQLEKFKSVFHNSVGSENRKRADTLQDVWEEIADKVNEVNTGSPRTVAELQKKWTIDLIQNKPGPRASSDQSTCVRPLGRPMDGSSTLSKSKHSVVKNVRKVQPAPSATITSPEPDIPIKIELDNAESDQTHILGVVQPSACQSQPIITTELVTYHLPDPDTPPALTIPQACLRLQLVDDSDSPEIKEEPADDTEFSTQQSEVVSSFVQQRISAVNLTGPSDIDLVMKQEDWEKLVILVNQTDPQHVHSMSNVKDRVRWTVKFVDDLLLLKARNSVNITGNAAKFLENQVRDHRNVLLNQGSDARSRQSKNDTWKLITELINVAYGFGYTPHEIQSAGYQFVDQLSMEQSHKRCSSPSQDSDIPTKAIKVEPQEVLVTPRWMKGDIVKAKHGEFWNEATIVDIDEDELRAKVHFHGLSRHCNKWVPMTRDFLLDSSRCIVKLPRISLTTKK